MKEGSYASIAPGMRVIGRDGETIGAVHEVVEDDATDIFVGLAVRPNLFTHSLLIPGDRVERLHEGVVYADVVVGELAEYLSPAERNREISLEYASGPTGPP